MKKLTLIAALGLLISSGLSAQKMNNIKTDLFSAFLRTYTLKYERAISEDASLQLGLFYCGYHPGDVNSELNGFAVTPEFRYFLSDTPAPNGTYIAPNIRYMNLTVSEDVSNASATFTSLGFGLNLGKQLVAKDVIVIDAWIGPTYNIRSISSSEIDAGIPDVNGFGVRVGLAIGLAF